MAEDKGSDLDVFEGLTKKKKQPQTSGTGAQQSAAESTGAPETIRGGLGPASRPLPAPKQSGGALPKPKLPPKKSDSSAPSSGVALPKPKLPPSRSSSGSALRDSDIPELVVQPMSISSVFEEPSGSVLPGHAVAELDWDDDEEATSVFDRSASDLFGELAGKARVYEEADADETAKRRHVGSAAALLASSGKSAQPVKSVPPTVVQEPDPLPRIPAPAPVPRDMSDANRPADMIEPMRDQHPSWAPSAAPPPRAQAQQQASKATILLALIAVLAAAAGVFFYLRSSSAATVIINVTHGGESVEKAAIFVDGRRECEFAPCKLELKPGRKKIRVVSGQLAGSTTLNVDGGKDMSVSVQLGVSGEPAPKESAEPPKDAPAKLKVASGMKDADIKLFVNGEDRGKLPVDLSDIKPGKVTLRFEGGDKFGKVEKTIDVKPGESITLDDIKLPLLKVKVEFELLTRGAKVKLIQEGDKKSESALAFRANKTAKTLDTTHTWKLLATLKGYEDFTKTLDFDGAGDTMKVKIELKKATEPAPVASTGPDPGPGPGPGPGPDPGPDPTTPPPAQDFGFINANSIPPSHVLIDGRPRGSTPVTGVKVKPGSHSVVFKHKKYGTKSRSVNVGAGQTKTATVRFKKKKKKK